MKINKGEDVDVIKALVISNGLEDPIVLIDGFDLEIRIITTDGKIIEGLFSYVDEETIEIVEYDELISIDRIEEIEVLSGSWF